jgi:hypothetical protein
MPGLTNCVGGEGREREFMAAKRLKRAQRKISDGFDTNYTS